MLLARAVAIAAAVATSRCCLAHRTRLRRPVPLLSQLLVLVLVLVWLPLCEARY